MEAPTLTYTVYAIPDTKPELQQMAVTLKNLGEALEELSKSMASNVACLERFSQRLLNIESKIDEKEWHIQEQKELG